jgi:hypothetical protein
VALGAVLEVQARAGGHRFNRHERFQLERRRRDRLGLLLAAARSKQHSRSDQDAGKSGIQKMQTGNLGGQMINAGCAK